MAEHFIPIDAPARSPRLGGIRTVAEFETQSRLGVGGKLEFISPGCTFPVDDIVLCYPLPRPTQTGKTDVGIDTLNGVVDPFGLYVGVECWLGNGDDYEARAKDLLAQGEDRGIEKRMDTYFGTLSSNSGATFLDAIALAEDHADDNYLGRPIIWMNRGDAVLARSAKALESEKGTGNLFTANGTPVIASGQITVKRLAVTGSVKVAHSDVITSRAPMVTVNRDLALAERIYAVALDCAYARRYTIT